MRLLYELFVHGYRSSIQAISEPESCQTMFTPCFLHSGLALYRSAPLNYEVTVAFWQSSAAHMQLFFCVGGPSPRPPVLRARPPSWLSGGGDLNKGRSAFAPEAIPLEHRTNQK